MSLLAVAHDTDDLSHSLSAPERLHISSVPVSPVDLLSPDVLCSGCPAGRG